jgi:L-ascorbate metabolism protein UlaG (beta-lactamase superfamily)
MRNVLVENLLIATGKKMVEDTFHMLNFIGIGSAFHTRLGNTSAFIKRQDCLLLIDSGGTVFHKLQVLNILRVLKKIYIVITHTHPDHVGSLGEVIFYSYYILGHKPTVFFPNRDLIKSFLTSIGVSQEMYLLESSNKVGFIDENLGDVSIEFLPVSHVAAIPAYGFVMKQAEGVFYYSGDSNSIENEIITRLKSGELDRIYQDTCGLDYEGNNHMSLRKLQERIHPDLRNKVYCMHLDQHIDQKEIVDQGFNVVKQFQKNKIPVSSL